LRLATFPGDLGENCQCVAFFTSTATPGFMEFGTVIAILKIVADTIGG